MTHIIFGGRFNQPLDSLPSTVTHIKFQYQQSDETIKFLEDKLINISFGSPKVKNYSEFSWKKYFQQFD